VDLFSLVTGLVFTAIACVYLTAAASDRNVGGEWVLPVVLVTVGLASLVGLLRGREKSEEPASAVSREDAGDTLVLSRDDEADR
jgi:hypothetical protein